MKKFIAISGAILLGTVAASNPIEERLQNIVNEIAHIENDISFIKGNLQQAAQRKRASSVEALDVESPLFGFGRKPISRPVIHTTPTHTTPTHTTPSMHPLEKLRLGTDIISGLGVTGA